MSVRYPAVVRQRAVKMLLAHLDEYDSVYQAAQAIGPKVGVGPESLRRWAVAKIGEDDPANVQVLEERAESKRVKDLERKVRDLQEANEILKAASIFFAGELDPRKLRR
jgi:transposase-like protein